MSEDEKKPRFYAKGNVVYWRGVTITTQNGGIVTADRAVCELPMAPDVMSPEALAALLNAGYEALGGPKF